MEKPVSRAEFGQVALRIAAGLVAARKEFKGSVRRYAANVDEVPELERALVAYQIGLAEVMVAAEGYVTPSDQQIFADFLWNTICGTKIADYGSWYERYLGGERERVFVSDVRELLGADTEIYLLAPIAEMYLTANTCWSVYRGLGDDKKRLETEEKIRNMIERECKLFCVTGLGLYSIKEIVPWPSQIPLTS